MAFQIRFDGNLPAIEQHLLWSLILPVMAGRILSLYAFKVANHGWRYTSFDDAFRLAAAHLPVTAALLIARIAMPAPYAIPISLGVIAIDYLLCIVVSLGGRSWWRYLCRRSAQSRSGDGASKKLLLVGAGYHGAMIASELTRKKGIAVVGFLDDDRRKVGSTIAGVKVLGPVEGLEDCVQRHGVDEVLVCIPPSQRRNLKLSRLAKTDGTRVKVMPSIDEVLQGDFGLAAPKNGQNSGTEISPRTPADISRRVSSIRQKRILITGGAGFIGSTLAARLGAGNDLLLYDLSFNNKPIQYANIPSNARVEMVEGDILDEKMLEKLCRDVDVVIHTAAVLGVSKVCEAARDTLEVNYLGTARLLKALENNNRLERLVYFSTSEVFGVNSYRVTEDAPSSIGSSTEARWSYAIAKVAGEHLVRSYHRETGMPVTIVRPFNVFGPRRTGDYALLRFIAAALKGAPIEVHGDGSQIRAWCYIDDFCDAILKMVELPQAVGQDFNIGNPANTVTITELARRVIELSGSQSQIVHIEHPYPDITIRVPSLTKAQELLGYEPKIDLDRGLRLTIDWYRANRQLLEKPGKPMTVRASA
jgi:nucleoside-diphosphate-sugar epimerase